MKSHPAARLWHVEDLVRRRRADAQRRFLASQRSGRIDPNPHQIDAVIFALSRIDQGGCILADEVGLGKTIEAGLVIAQMQAEGAQRILLITPKPLLGQWRHELATLFDIETTEVTKDPDSCHGSGVFIAGREFAGSHATSMMIAQSGSFDLAVIDEAHEIFAGIYRRYDRHGQIRPDSRYATTAARVRRFLAQTPVLLLTATPIQNSLTELWGLVQYVEPTGTLLGDLPTFRTVFCDGDDRRLRDGQDEELRRRIASVCQRTLRKEAQEFMEHKFVRRRARLFEYSMTPAERALYDDVTAYLLEPNLAAFRGGNRKLLLIGFHRRMASSIRALSASLDNVAKRLRHQLRGDPEPTLPGLPEDFEDDDPPAGLSEVDEGPPTPRQRISAELARVEGFAATARTLSRDSKVQELVSAVRYVLRQAEQGASGKLVIFTEALTTQDYLREVLIEHQVVVDQEITVFRGTNTGHRVQEAVDRWDEEVGSTIPEHARPSRGVAVRLALVHEFATRTKVLLATEAGAKGLNLQFCDTVINYDLPWNPQRIEQRIGRCHRYGQTRDVTVINFLARDNDAQRLTFDILSRKLELFGTVLDASDAVLFEPGEQRSVLLGGLSVDFDAHLARLYERAASVEELNTSLGQLRDEMETRKQELKRAHERTAGLIEARLSDAVRGAFRQLQSEIPKGLAAFDTEVQAVLERYLTAIEAGFTRHEEPGRLDYRIEPHPQLPKGLNSGAEVAVGRVRGRSGPPPLHLGHPLISGAVEEARRACRESFWVRLVPDAAGAAALGRQRGKTGRIAVMKVHYGGFEPIVELVPVVVFAGENEPLATEVGRMLMDAGELTDVEPFAGGVDDDLLDEVVHEALFIHQGEVEPHEHRRFEDTVARIERSMDDKIFVVRRTLAELDESLAEAMHRRDRAASAVARAEAERQCRELGTERDSAAAEIARLVARDDEQYEVWRQQAYQRRYAKPRVEQILALEFVLG